MLHKAVEVSVRPLVAEAVAERAGRSDPLWDDWVAFAKRYAPLIEKTEREIRREVMVHFRTTQPLTWRLQDFEAPFLAMGRQFQEQESFRHIQRYADTLTDLEFPQLLFRSFARNMQIIRSLHTLFSSTPEDQQCEHLWALQDATARLIRFGSQFSSATAPGLPTATRVLLYGTLVLEEIYSDRIEFDQVFRLKRAIEDVLPAGSEPPEEASPAHG